MQRITETIKVYNKSFTFSCYHETHIDHRYLGSSNERHEVTGVEKKESVRVVDSQVCSYYISDSFHLTARS